MLTRIRQAGHRLCNRLGYRLEKIHPHFPVVRNALDPNGVEVLGDAEFQASCREVFGLSLLDVPRLANLWQLCRRSNPAGGIIEVGTYRGGGALHLSNCCPDRRLIVCDSFEGFETLHPGLDDNFDASMFTDTRAESVRALFARKRREALVVQGFFPGSCKSIDLGLLSFAHVDVDVYKATLESLHYLSGRMLDRSYIVLDDFDRRAAGVNRAVAEFTATDRRWQAVPMFPGQAVLVHRSWFD